MAEDEASKTNHPRGIRVIGNGPYVVEGDIPLVSKTQVVSEFGEPLTWQKDGTLPVSEGEYHLCRCGKSGNLPFCDGTHRKIAFDGEETAPGRSTKARAQVIPGGTCIFVRRDQTICTQSGFCGLRDVRLGQLVAESADTRVRSLVMAMVEHCPSGSLTYSLEPEGPDIEPDLPQQIAVTTEITAQGTIPGPLWVTGGIPVTRSDGRPFETRNRVTLCNCGRSWNKPLCDGTHRLGLHRKPEDPGNG